MGKLREGWEEEEVMYDFSESSKKKYYWPPLPSNVDPIPSTKWIVDLIFEHGAPRCEGERDEW